MASNEICSLTTWTQSQTKHGEYLASRSHAHGTTACHATSVIKKTGKLKFIKVCETFDIGVAKNSAPDKNSRARRKDRPKLLREPRKFQEILRIEVLGSLEHYIQR